MLVKDIMTYDVQCVRPQDNIARVAERMRDMDVGSLPVCGDDDLLAGMVTDRDITVRATAGCCAPSETAVSEVMTPNVVYCFDDPDVSDAANLMEQNQIRRIVVLDRDKRLVGIVSLGDLAVKNMDERLTGEALERVSQPATPA